MINTDKTITCCDCQKSVPCEKGNLIYDASVPTMLGRWGYLCSHCFYQNGCELGTGKGQRFQAKGGKWAKVAG